MSSLPGPLRLQPSFPFAGRMRELGALAALLPRAEGEGRRVALVAGEPGSGKSRLVRELAQRAAADRALVLYGACDAVVAEPYRPFVEALDRIVREADPDVLRRDLGAGGGELLRLLPGLSSLLGDVPQRAAADADAERHRLHTAVADFLRAIGERTPILFVLEDVHWADSSTLRLLRHLERAAADTRLLLVVTYRDVEADVPAELSETLVELIRAEGVVRVRLGGLTEAEVGEFVRLVTGVDAGQDVARTIEELTEGNAFLLTELWRELVESDALDLRNATVMLARPVSDIGTPETVRQVVMQRLARLDATTARVIELAAVHGPEIELDTLRRACSLAEGALLDAVDAAVRSGIAVETPGYGLSYRFAHELVRRSVVDRLSAAHRAELHVRVAEALESAPAHGDPRSRLAALAHHFAEGAPVGGGERAVAYNLLAAESAAAALAFDEAEERFRTALALGVEASAERARITLALGYACHRGGKAAEALAAFRETAILAREANDADLLARAAVGFEEACWRPGIHTEGSIELLEEAAEHLGDAPSELRVRLLGALARARDLSGDYAAAAIARDESITLARRRGDRAALGWVLSASYWSRGVTSNEEINDMLGEARQIADERDDPELRTEALAWLVPSYVVLCDHASARVELDHLFESARRVNQPFHLHVAEHYAAALSLCDGDLVGAELAAERSREWSRLLTGRDASGVYGIQMFGIRREQGRLAELAPVVRLLAADARGGPWAPGLAAVLAELGMETEARRELDRLRDRSFEDLRATLWLAGLVYLTDAARALDDRRTAELLYPYLEPYAGTNVMVGHLVSCYGAADRYLGMLATVLGDWDRAEAHFEAALALNRELGARTWVAHTAYEYGRMLIARDGRDDRAASLLGEAVAVAEAVGMPSLLSRVAALGRRVETGRALPDGLSPREAETLVLVARGLSNREIGAALHISEHTAANHVRSILRKTGCANRTDAAGYAHRRGLTGD